VILIKVKIKKKKRTQLSNTPTAAVKKNDEVFLSGNRGSKSSFNIDTEEQTSSFYLCLHSRWRSRALFFFSSSSFFFSSSCCSGVMAAFFRSSSSFSSSLRFFWRAFSIFLFVRYLHFAHLFSCEQPSSLHVS